jgi:hypothetical protein
MVKPVFMSLQKKTSLHVGSMEFLVVNGPTQLALQLTSPSVHVSSRRPHCASTLSALRHAMCYPNICESAKYRYVRRLPKGYRHLHQLLWPWGQKKYWTNKMSTIMKHRTWYGSSMCADYRAPNS